MNQPESKKAVCPCGNKIEIPVVVRDDDWADFEYDVCNQECPKCHRQTTSGNWKTGEVSGWITHNYSRALIESELEYERQCFEADMNEWYGRGEW